MLYDKIKDRLLGPGTILETIRVRPCIVVIEYTIGANIEEIHMDRHNKYIESSCKAEETNIYSGIDKTVLIFMITRCCYLMDV